MRWLYLLCVCFVTDGSQRLQSGVSVAAENTFADAAAMYNALGSPEERKPLLRLEFPTRRFSSWSAWGPCESGSRSRRKHCIIKEICGNTLRIEVASCTDSRDRRDRGKSGENVRPPSREDGRKHKPLEMRQINISSDVQRMYRGFSPWGPWSTCSRKCTTVRRRHCRRIRICGKRVIRQSAYCYVEGSYCHRWIKGRMQWPKDPGYTMMESEPNTLASPVYPRVPDSDPPCGLLGRYRGSYVNEMKRIIGGRIAPLGKWPWQVLLLDRYKEQICAGTLISLRWVVSAAHCVRKKIFVVLGEYNRRIRDPGEVEMRVTKAIKHPRYDPYTLHNDVAMLRLPEPARPTWGHGVACLPRPHQYLPPSTSCFILGWGKQRVTDATGTRVLYEAQVPTVSQGVCRRAYSHFTQIIDSMLCAGSDGRDSCAGDSGGPLLCRDNTRYYLQGITSFGEGCGKRGKYGIYMRTSSYVGWIHKIMGGEYLD